MVFDSPKAVHFVVTRNGERIDEDISLKIRWEVANRAREAGVVDMRNLSFSERLAIGKICGEFNKLGDTCVQLRLSPEQCGHDTERN